MPGGADFAIGAWTSPPCNNADYFGAGQNATKPGRGKKGATRSSKGHDDAKSPKIHDQKCPTASIDGYDATICALYAAVYGDEKSGLQGYRNIGVTLDSQAEAPSRVGAWRFEEARPWTPYGEVSGHKMMQSRYEKQEIQAKDNFEDANTEIG